MIHHLFAIFDSKAKIYLPPFNSNNQATARRTFDNIVNSDGTQIAANPQDFTLFGIGKFDDQKGMLEPKTPESLGNGVEFIKPTDQQSLPLE